GRATVGVVVAGAKVKAREGHFGAVGREAERAVGIHFQARAHVAEIGPVVGRGDGDTAHELPGHVQRAIDGRVLIDVGRNGHVGAARPARVAEA
nr:hypothetical protein [Tanacetum cinerariifolium]